MLNKRGMWQKGFMPNLNSIAEAESRIVALAKLIDSAQKDMTETLEDLRCLRTLEEQRLHG